MDQFKSVIGGVASTVVPAAQKAAAAVAATAASATQQKQSSPAATGGLNADDSNDSLFDRIDAKLLQLKNKEEDISVTGGMSDEDVDENSGFLGRSRSNSSSGFFGRVSSIRQSISSKIWSQPNRNNSEAQSDSVAIEIEQRSRSAPSSGATSSQPPSVLSRIGGGLSSVRTTISTRLGLSEPEPPQPVSWRDAFSQELNSYISLSKTQRMYGFLICLGLGLLCIGVSLPMVPYILIFAPLFGLTYTMGNLLLLVSTFFIVGPMQQLKNMVSSERIIPSIVYILSMILTMLVAFKLRSFILVIIFVVVQTVSFAWYIISYIPFGQRILWISLRSFASMF